MGVGKKRLKRLINISSSEVQEMSVKKYQMTLTESL